MKLFGQIIRVCVDAATIPVAVVKDVHALAVGDSPTAIRNKLEEIKDDAEEAK